MSGDSEHVHDESCMPDVMALIPVLVKLLPTLVGGLQLAIELSEQMVLEGRSSVEDILEQVTDIKEVLNFLLHTFGADPNFFDTVDPNNP